MNKLTPKIIRKRSDFIKKTRDFFYKKNFIEVDTPHLVAHPSLEPYLDPYAVKIENDETHYLITSPEFSMKKILGMGCDKIFEIAHAWRSEERGEWHSREFLMLEWYWVGATMEKVIDMSHQLINELLEKNISKKEYSIEEWFQINYQHGCSRVELENNLKEQIENVESRSYEELFFRLFLPTESRLEELGLVFLKNYPPELRAYSKVENGVAKRFEIYFNGLELGNAFFEEKSKKELEEILKKEQNKRVELNKSPLTVDQDFVECLNHIKEPITGIALGLDRLFALSCGAKKLSEISFYQQNI